MERSELFLTLKSSWENKEISAREAARQLGVYHKTFLYWMKKKYLWGKKYTFFPTVISLIKMNYALISISTLHIKNLL